MYTINVDKKGITEKNIPFKYELYSYTCESAEHLSRDILKFSDPDGENFSLGIDGLRITVFYTMNLAKFVKDATWEMLKSPRQGDIWAEAQYTVGLTILEAELMGICKMCHRSLHKMITGAFATQL